MNSSGVNDAEPAFSASCPPAVPGYELLRCIGRGSYGEVWLARSAAAEFRAVKVVYRKTFEHDRPYERELSGIQKFEPVSRSHASQVSILQVGRNLDAGYFYYVMELADDANAECGVRSAESQAAGEESDERAVPHSFNPATYVPKTLKSVLNKRGRLSFRECLEISLALTTALDHLHQNGLIHRDIKPSNVIFVDDVPKLADIGLVTDAGATISFVGTEGFLPPEGPGTAQADLYSLGKVLYEISTGRDRMDFPELPTFVDAPGEKDYLLELNQIFLKACQNDPRKRYQSAGEMFSDLKLLHSGRSLRRARAVEQRLVQVRALAVAAVLLVVAIALANHFLQLRRLHRAEQEKALQERDARTARGVAADKTHRLADLYAANGNTLAAQGDISGALVWHAKALSDDPTDPARSESHHREILSLLDRCPRMPLLLAHQAGIHSAEFSADGRRVITASDDQTVQVWDARTGEPIGPTLKHSGRVLHGELSPDGARALTLADDGFVQIWSSFDTKPAAVKLAHDRPVRDARLSPTGRQVLTLTDGPEVRIWETSGGRARFVLRHGEPVLSATFSSDGRIVATACKDGSAKTWNAETGETLADIARATGPIAALAFSPNNRRLALVSGVEVRVCDARSGDPAPFTFRHDAPVRVAAFSRDGQRLLTAGDDSLIRIWNAVTGRPLAPPLQHDAPIRDASFSPDGRFVAAAAGTRVRLWNALTFEPLAPVLTHNAIVQSIRFSPSGDCVLTASADGTARGFAWERNEGAGKNNKIRDSDFLPLAQSLSGRQITTGEQMAAADAATQHRLWRELKTKYPAEFERPDAVAWHQRTAEACEQARHWFSAGFHWERALAFKPADAILTQRRERAAVELARAAESNARGPDLPRRIPARPANAGERLLDLSPHYNAALTETWLPAAGIALANDLAALPAGVRKFGGVEFDVRGVIQLAGAALENLGGSFPEQVTGIRVGQPVRRLHVLHGAAWSALFGTHLGGYLVRYTNGETREIKIVFGQNVREWWAAPTQPQPANSAAVAWEGSNPASRALGMKLRLYQITWINPLPDMPIASIDFRSTMENPAPFLIAITVE